MTVISAVGKGAGTPPSGGLEGSDRAGQGMGDSQAVPRRAGEWPRWGHGLWGSASLSSPRLGERWEWEPPRAGTPRGLTGHKCSLLGNSFFLPVRNWTRPQGTRCHTEPSTRGAAGVGGPLRRVATSLCSLTRSTGHFHVCGWHYEQKGKGQTTPPHPC